MKHLLISTLTVATPAFATTLNVPSGQTVIYSDTIQNEPGVSGLTYRFRFVAPAIARDGGSIGIDKAAADMDYLCTTYALPHLAGAAELPEQIIISLSDRSVEFGEPAPEVTQFFEAYRVEDGTCIWEGF